MNLLIILKVAMRSLSRTLMRSSLTTLGIVIGVAAVIAMVSIGNGAKARVESYLAKLDANQIFLIARERRNGQPLPVLPGRGFTIADYRALLQEIEGIAAASPQLHVTSAGNQVQGRGRSSSAQIMGYDAGAFRLFGRKMVAGAGFGEIDVRNAANVAVITEHVAGNLFPDRSPLGQPIRVGTIPFVVIGVMADDTMGFNRQAGTSDSGVWLPYSSVIRRLDRDAANAMVIYLKAQHPAYIARIQQDLKDLMERRRGNRTAEFHIEGMGESMATFAAGSRTMTMLLAAIAGISLVVGGIGVMNIMLVSVTERTREIGIRLAIGTRGRDVLRQFLIESVILSLLGGLMGILLGVGAAKLITYLNDWPTKITVGSILAAFLCSAAIGIFFGYYPARQAARLDPIEALRSE